MTARLGASVREGAGAGAGWKGGAWRSATSWASGCVKATWAVVYRATDLRTRGPVAVKLLAPALAHSAVSRQRLQREAQLAAGLSSPRVVRVLDLFEHQGTPVLVMEYVARETLADLLRRRRPLPVAEAVDLAREIARALTAAHAQGVIHRDLKPANIKLVEGQVKVLDFGLARLAAGDSLSASGGYLGTPEYSAPEQADGQADARTDVYALGMVLYELLPGQPPFRAASPLAVLRQHVEAPVLPLPPERPRPCGLSWRAAWPRSRLFATSPRPNWTRRSRICSGSGRVDPARRAHPRPRLTYHHSRARRPGTTCQPNSAPSWAGSKRSRPCDSSWLPIAW